MKGPIYDYERQRWTAIDTEGDRQTGPWSYVTSDGVAYDLNPQNPSQYRNGQNPNREG